MGPSGAAAAGGGARRYAVLAVGAAMEFCLGIMYSWSAFVPALRSAHGLTTAETQVIYGTMIFVSTCFTIVGGRLERRFGARIVSLTGGVVLCLGFVLASRSGGRFAPLLLSLAFVAAPGIGLAYICPLAVLPRWFPAHAGLVLGVAVGVYASASAVISQAAEVFLSRGIDVLLVFRWIGLVAGGGVVATSFFLFAAPADVSRSEARAASLRTFLATRRFWVVFGGMFLTGFAGLLVNGNLKPLGLAAGIPSRAAALAVGAFGIGMAAGRLAWGRIYDKFGRRSIPAALGLLGAAVFVLALPGAGPHAFLPAAGAVGFAYGACFVAFAARVAALWGSRHVGSVYPWALMAYAFSAPVGPVAAGWLYDSTGSYLSAILLGGSLATAGAVAYGFLDRSS